MKKKLVSIVIAAGAIIGLSACAGVNEDIGPASMGCVFNKKTGELVGGPRLTGSEVNLKTDEELFRLPLSDRFWNMSAGSAKDASASQYFIGRDVENRETRGQGEIKFIIHPANGCEFFVEHLYRYLPLGFEVEGDPNTGWMKVLARNVDTSITLAFDKIIAQENGLLAALELPTNANTDGSLPEGEAPETTLREKLTGTNTAFGAQIVAEIEQKLGGKYICGPTTNVADPNDCDPVSVEVFTIDLDPKYNEVVAGWESVQLQLSQAELDRRQELINASTFEDEQAALAAENERNAAIRELNNQDKLNQLESERELEEARAAEAASRELAVCEEAAQVFGSVISAQDCIELLAVTSGQYTRGGNVTINSDGG